MRCLIIALMFFLPMAVQSQYQYITNDYFELGAFFGTMNKQLIEHGSKRGELVSGYGSLENQGLFIRYGKGLASFAHLNLGLSYSKRMENLEEDVVVSGNQITVGNIEQVDLTSYTVEFGPRFRLIGHEVIEMSLGFGGLGRITRESEYSPKAGYYVRALVGINLTRRLQVNGSYAFETTEGRYRYQSFPISFAIQYKIY